MAATVPRAEERLAIQLVMFLQDQKEAMKDVMETATTAPTMVALREAQLLVQLMRSALSAVSDEDLVREGGHYVFSAHC